MKYVQSLLKIDHMLKSRKSLFGVQSMQPFEELRHLLRRNI